MEASMNKSRTPRYTTPWMAVAASVLAVALNCRSVAEPPQYEVVVLDLPDYATGVWPWGINDKAQIVGSYGDQGKPFLWDRGQFIALDMPFDYSIARCEAINTAGQITGTMRKGSPPTRSFVYEGGEYTDLGVVDGGDTTWGLAINHSCQITGYSGSGIYGDWRACLWQNGVLNDLGADFPESDSRGLDLNEHAQITGYMWTGGEDRTAFIWDQGLVQDLGPVPGGSISEGRAINNNGEVAVQGAIPGSTACGFFYRDGEMIDIGLVPGATRCQVCDINDAAEIVGNCDDYPDGNDEWAFAWRDGVMDTLNDLVPPELDLDLRWCFAVNNAGQIPAKGYQARASVIVLLTPIKPRPADVNRDGRVDIDDLFEVLCGWGLCPDPPQVCPADVDEDSTVDINDIFTLLADWG